MADNFDLQRAGDIANESDAAHRRARCNERRRHCKKRIASTDGIHHIFGKRRDRVDDAAAFEGDAAVLALRDYDLRAVEIALRQPPRDIADVRNPIADGEPSLGRVDADIIGPADIW